MWGLGGDFVMFAQGGRRQKAQHRDHYDVVTVLSEENCMRQERSEQRKSRPPENGPRKRPEERACHGTEPERGIVPEPTEGRKPDRDGREREVPRAARRPR